MLLTAISIALFVTSLFYPVFRCGLSTNWLGKEVLMAGWLGLLSFDPRWLLNLLFLFVVTSNLIPREIYSSNKTAYSIVLIIGALSTLFIPAMGCGSAASGTRLSDGLAIGGYFWVVAITLGAACSFITLTHHSSGTPDGAP